LLAALSRVLLTTLLARLLLSAATLLAPLSRVLLATLLARLLFTRIHNGSFVGPPTYNETQPSQVPSILEGKRTQPHWNLSSEMTVCTEN
jgi:hypothetical protein